MNAEMDILKNQWRSTGGKGSKAIIYVALGLIQELQKKSIIGIRCLGFLCFYVKLRDTAHQVLDMI